MNVKSLDINSDLNNYSSESENLKATIIVYFLSHYSEKKNVFFLFIVFKRKKQQSQKHNYKVFILRV